MLPAAAVTLGMFDGVHRGHQALLQTCRRHARAEGVPAAVLTYEPHPSRVLRPDNPTPRLTLLPEKLSLLAEYGMDYVIIAEFTHAFSLQTPAQFIADVLCRPLHPTIVVAGYRTTFGHARAGSAPVLEELGRQCGFGVEIVPPIEVVGAPVSSSRIRQCLAEEGDIALATEFLGHPYLMAGTVVVGDQRGRTLGIPTANLAVDPEKLVPAEGVYAVDAFVDGVRRRAVMSIGMRPTFERPAALEVHLLDFSGDLYGRTLTVEFLQRLREIRTFDRVDDLLAAIRDDIAQARALLAPTG